MKRGIFDLVFFIILFTTPWWLGVLFAFFGVFFFENFYEFIISGIIIYSLYTIPGSSIFTSLVSFFSIIVLLYVFIQLLRDKIIFYNNKF